MGGASRGIGRAIALELVRGGANVGSNFRADVKHAESAADEIRELGGECLLVQGNVAKKGAAARIVKEVLDKWQRLEILVNNANITRDRSTRTMTDDDWAAVINVNLNGTFYRISAALPAIGQSEVWADHQCQLGCRQMGVHLARPTTRPARAASSPFTKTFALEVARFNITANAIAPGFTSTEMMDAIPKRLPRRSRPRFLWERFASPEEIAKASAFLAADGD